MFHRFISLHEFAPKQKQVSDHRVRSMPIGLWHYSATLDYLYTSGPVATVAQGS